jgi:hypothetical protein
LDEIGKGWKMVKVRPEAADSASPPDPKDAPDERSPFRSVSNPKLPAPEELR